jgi:hypothetical protein
MMSWLGIINIMVALLLEPITMLGGLLVSLPSLNDLIFYKNFIKIISLINYYNGGQGGYPLEAFRPI